MNKEHQDYIIEDPLNPHHVPLKFSRRQILANISYFIGKEKLEEVVNNTRALAELNAISSFIVPTYIIEFINKIAKTVNPTNHFDPLATISSPCLYYGFDNTIAYCIDKKEFDLINTIFHMPQLDLLLGDSNSFINNYKNQFDLVTCFPPFYSRKENLRINRKVFSLDMSLSILIKSAYLLSEKGKAIFLLPSSFLFIRDLKEALLTEGLFIDAIFSLPSGTFIPVTRISTMLVVLSKQESNKTFVAELARDEQNIDIVFENYINRKEGKIIQLGTLVDVLSFRSLKEEISKKEVSDLSNQLGFPIVKLGDIALSIKLLKCDNKDEIVQLPNSIYLPKIGNSPSVIDLSDMKIKPHNYYQIQLNSESANAIYVSNFFNNEVGKKIRQSLETGSTIRFIPQTLLILCKIPLPEINTQLELINVGNKIDQFSIRLSELKRNLWKHPKVYKSILKDLKNINNEEKLEHWIDTMPFPISSILWLYYATQDVKSKRDHLFHFFEAFSEFESMILLSALKTDKEFYMQENHKWLDTDVKFKEWYLKSDYGSWSILLSRLSKSIRQYLDDKDTRELCLSLLGNPSSSYVKMITSKEIVSIHKTVTELRNKWKGHDGFFSEEVLKNQLSTLEQYLNDLRRLIADGYDDFTLISPSTNSYEAGMFNYSARALVGAKTPFQVVSIKSLIPLDINKLYIAHLNQFKPVEVIPFIKYIESSNAIYFYSSIESKTVRWISYHSEKTPELNQPIDDEIEKAFELLKPSK